jgi:hypothetical protein
VLDYAGAARESTFVDRIRDLARERWFRGRKQSITNSDLVHRALILRGVHERKLQQLLKRIDGTTGFERKRLVPKLRYYAGRAIYLASEESLASLASEVKGVPETRLYGELMAALADGNIDRILGMGLNAAQAVAQPLRAGNRPCKTALSEFSSKEEEGLAILLLNGVTPFGSDRLESLTSQLMQIAMEGSNTGLMKDGEAFLRELACLHGLADEAQHASILDSVLDEDEDLVMDAVTQLGQSLSY